MLNLKNKKSSDAAPKEAYRARFQESLFSALSDVIFTDQFDTAILSVLSAIERAFNCDTFLFSRSGDSAALVRFSAEKPDQFAPLFKKAGIRLTADRVPLSGGRKKIFETPFVEYEDFFHLLGDMTTSAACRKIQNALQVNSVATASLKSESAQLVLVLLLRERPSSLKQDLGRFVFLLKAAYHLSALKDRLRTLEARFDEQVISLKNDLREKESAHLYLFNAMPIAAAVLDERGVVTEANETLTQVAGTGVNPVGQSFSSILAEEDRRDFIEFFVGLAAGESASTTTSISGRHFKVHIVTREKDDGKKGLSVAYLVDDTADVELQRELGRTMDALRAEKESVERVAADTEEYSVQIVKGSAVPTLLVSDGKVKVASDSLANMFSVMEGEAFEEFLSANGLTIPPENENESEVSDAKGRTISVSRWRIAGADFFAFADVSEFRRMEEELRKSTEESEGLFNGSLPTAAVNEGVVSRWNDMFQSLFGEFLSSDKSFDGFLRYLGESPESFKSEMQTNGIARRVCRTTDRKYLNVSAALAHGTVFLFMEDITEQESMKQQLRAAQGLLSTLLESFAEEPVFIVENGILRASNVAARNKLGIKLDEQIDPAKILAGVGIVKADDTGELNGRFYKVENISVGASQVYRFRLVNQEVTQRAEIDKLKHRQGILRDIAAAEKFEGILQGLSELLKADGYANAKVVGTGTLQVSRGSGDVYLLAMASGKIEPSLSLSLTESDISAVRHGGSLSGIEVPDSTFMNVISSGDSRLLVQSTSVGDSVGFASIALPATGVPPKYIDELAPIMKAASSVAAGLYARMSAERKFEDSGKVTRAVVGLTGIGEGTFEETARRFIDLLRQVFAAESVGVYMLEGPSMRLLLSNGGFPEMLSVPATRFGALLPANQLEAADMKNAEGLYFAVKSRSQQLSLLFRFIAVSPSLSELNAVSAVSLDILEANKSMGEQRKISEQLVANSKSMSEFMVRLSKAVVPEDVLKVLGDSLATKMNNASVSFRTDGKSSETVPPMELVEKEGAGSGVYEANFTSVGLGVLAVRCSGDQLSKTMVELAVDKLRSLFAVKLPAAQTEASVLRTRLDRSKEEYEKLKESIEKIPGSLRNARIGIDNVLSRLSFVQGEEKVMQEIRLHLAAAAKEMSIDLDSSSRNQEELFEAVRSAVLKPNTGSDSSPLRIRSFETSVLTEFRTNEATFDLLRDLFSNVVLISGVKEGDVLMTASPPGPGDAAEGKGKRVSIRLTTAEGESVDEQQIEGSASIRALVGKLEKLGYGVDADVVGNEMTLAIFETKPGEALDTGQLSALLVEDDKHLVDEESQILLQVFSRLKVAGDAVEAAKIFEAEKFNLAFIDLSLPSINGRELCSQLKKERPDCITVLMTNREGEEKSEGVDHIVLRPLEVDAITKYINR